MKRKKAKNEQVNWKMMLEKATKGLRTSDLSLVRKKDEYDISKGGNIERVRLDKITVKNFT